MSKLYLDWCYCNQLGDEKWLVLLVSCWRCVSRGEMQVWPVLHEALPSRRPFLDAGDVGSLKARLGPSGSLSRAAYARLKR